MLVLVLAFLFTLGFHLGTPAEPTRRGEVILTVSVIRRWGEPFSEEGLMIDGKYETELLDYEKNSVRLIIAAELYSPGYLVGGAKYLSPNQPVKIYRDGAGFEGRIVKIESRDNAYKMVNKA